MKAKAKQKDSRRTGSASEKTRRKAVAQKPDTRPGSRKGFVPPQDERGVPYPGDWPNPLEGKVRGCY